MRVRGDRDLHAQFLCSLGGDVCQVKAIRLGVKLQAATALLGRRHQATQVDVIGLSELARRAITTRLDVYR